MNIAFQSLRLGVSVTLAMFALACGGDSEEEGAGQLPGRDLGPEQWLPADSWVADKWRDEAEASGIYGALICSAYDAPPRDGILAVYTPDQSEVVAYGRYRWIPDGESQMAGFAIVGLLPGEYIVEVDSPSNEVWAGAPWSVRAPMSDLEFYCSFGGDLVDVEFDVRGSQAHEEVDYWDARIWLDDTGSELDVGYDDNIARGVPRHSDVSWAVGANGYQITFGQEQVGSSGRSSHVIAVGLKEGWGQVVSVESEAGRPLVGAEVLVDGVSRGLTDQRGVYILNLDDCPSSLSAGMEGWEVVYSSFSPRVSDPCRGQAAVVRMALVQ